MASPVVISDQFLLWSQSQLLWTIAAYAVVADPLDGETSRFRWTRWAMLLALRVSFSVGIAYGLSRSLSLSALLLLITCLSHSCATACPCVGWRSLKASGSLPACSAA